ncbi:MAG: class I SAM-dependent methyltransferase [Anaerolineales bacterium]|jgi:2-polyprenyl-3-methyl-5-hydroxy-6-metoxy-1,4-benzoquinol methylase|nr:class I SAM-dependent methyltransferase [Anaerolineales bacterium]HJO32887.1 class I SAM-dependent methyltransferase [Anaerolineales bacterium]|tara:strand:+ start:2824 stop:3564 length:741 start_codon:yes stop_codon:yes gene_type:complete
MTTVERIIPADTPPGIVALHLKRYQFAREHTVGKQVLDIACGVGYGSLHLAEACKQVVGADIDWAAVDYARQQYAGRENLAFVQADAMRTGLAESQFDAVCSFETIEHVGDAGMFLSEIKRVLKPEGVLIVSTPRVERSDSRPANPYHHQEWSLADFKRLLRGSFRNVEVFGQFRRDTGASRWLKRLDVLGLRKRVIPLWLARQAAQAAGARAMADLHMEDIFIRRGDLRRASEIVAVASDGNHIV